MHRSVALGAKVLVPALLSLASFWPARAQTVPVNIYAFGRYMNIVGNGKGNASGCSCAVGGSQDSTFVARFWPLVLLGIALLCRRRSSAE